MNTEITEATPTDKIIQADEANSSELAFVEFNRDGVSYKGTHLNGLRHGQGRQVFGDGFVYEGDWVLDKMTGRGRMTSPNGFSYEGDFVDGKSHGVGRLRQPVGPVLVGEFHEGEPHGTVELAFENRFRSIVTFVHGRVNGPAMQFNANGQMFFEGEMLDNVYHGKGKLAYANGGVYEGHFIAGKRKGFGSLAFGDGAHFEGHFKDDRLSNGEYNLSMVPGHAIQTLKGVFNERNQLVSGEIRYKDGGVMQGLFSYSEEIQSEYPKILKGTTDKAWHPELKAHVTGTWFESHLSGEATLKFPKGNFFIGQWDAWDKKRPRHWFGKGKLYSGGDRVQLATFDGDLKI